MNNVLVVNAIVLFLATSLGYASWPYTIPDAASLGRYNSVAVDSLGWPHVAYCDYGADDLKYAYQDALGWHVEVPDSNCGDAVGVALALDGSGNPHIAYHRANGADLYVASKVGPAWQLEPVLVTNNVGRFPSIVLDTLSYEHVFCEDYTASRWVHAWRDTSGWHSETVDTSGNGYDDNNGTLCLGMSGVLCVGYRKHNELWYAEKLGYWSTTSVDANKSDSRIDMALDSESRPHIAYSRGLYGASRPWYAWYDQGGWHTELVEDTCSFVHVVALDRADVPHYVYGKKYTDDKVRHCWRINGQWYFENIYGPGGSLRPSLWYSFAFSQAGYSFLLSAFERANSDLLVFVRRDDTIPPSAPILTYPRDDSVVSDSAVNLLWQSASDNMSGVADYRVQLALDTSFTAVVRDTSLADTSSLVVLPETTYHWRVSARDSARNVGQWSSVWCFRVELPTGTDGPPQVPCIPDLQVAPNPANGCRVTVHWNLPRLCAKSLVISNVAGRTVFQCPLPVSMTGTMHMDLHALPAGVYLARLESTAFRTSKSELILIGTSF